MPTDVTIIVPVYNLEPYIRASIASITAQQFEGTMEIIIVDDGSADKSLSAARELQALDGRIRVISQRNSGVSVARNAGLEQATGRYILFVDGDDILRPNAVRALVDCISQSKDAILACGDFVRIRSLAQELPPAGSNPTYSDSDAVLKGILLCEYGVSACAKLFDREKIGALRFCTGKRINEDKYFLVQYLMLNRGTVVDLNDAIYGYYIRSGSVTNSPYSEKALDMIFFSERIQSEVAQIKPELIEAAKYNNVTTHLAILKKIIRSNMRKREADVYLKTRKRMLAVAKDLSPRQLRGHIGEVFVLKYFPPLYPLCVRIFYAVPAKHR